MAQSGVPFIGSKITLISRNDIRYEGTLYTIDTKERTVALSNVKSLGTENRRPGQPIPPSDEIVDYVIFRSDDIKDLHVAETAASPMPPTGWPQQQMQFGQFAPYPGPFIPQPGFVPPFSGYMPMAGMYGYPPQGFPPQQTQQAQQPPQQPSQQPPKQLPQDRTSEKGAQATVTRQSEPAPVSAAADNTAAKPVVSEKKGPAQHGRQQAHHRQHQHHQEQHQRVAPLAEKQGKQQTSQEHQSQGTRALPGTGQYVRTRGHGTASVGQDFDFDAANQAFDKEKMLEELTTKPTPAETTPAIPTVPAYNKDSFFDSLSTGTTQRATREELRQQREVDLETFGALSISRFRRGRGSAGARRGRGRGRGQGQPAPTTSDA